MKKYDPNVTKIKARNAQVFQETTAIIRDGYYFAPSGERVDIHMQSMIAGGRCYHKELKPVNMPKVEGGTGILVLKGDCLKEAEALVQNGYNPAVLNFASAGHPGGGVETGARAQEETICRRSTLTRSIYGFDAKYAHRYGYTHREGNNYPISQSLDFSMIYSPDVTVFREAGQEYTLMEHPFNIAVITNAALNLGGSHAICLTPDGHMPQKAKDITRNKIRAILRVGLIKGHDSLVLGAFGCGAFHNPPREMAQLFKEVLAEAEFVDRYRLIIFAILSDHNDKTGNLKAFQEVFDPDADIFENAEQHAGHWSEHKDSLHEKVLGFLGKLNAEAEAEEGTSKIDTTNDGSASTQQPAKKRKQSPKTGLRVILPNGTLIQEKSAKNTFIEAIRRVIQKVGAQALLQKEASKNVKLPIISDTPFTKYSKKRKPNLVDGVYVWTVTSTPYKKQLLDRIGNDHGMNWTVEIV